jgi:hypothetical protein
MTERELRILRRLADELAALRQEIHATQQKQYSTPEHGSQQPIRPLQAEIQTDAVTQQAIREYYTSENQERNSWWGRNRRLIQTAGVIAAVVLAGLTYWTYREIQKQTPAITQSANAAKSAAQTADNSMKLAYGPRFAVTSGIRCEVDNREMLKISFDFVNNGATNITNVRVYKFSAVGPPRNRPVVRYVEDGTYPKVIIPNKPDGWAYYGDRPLSKSEISDLQSGKLWATFSVLWTYSDIFGDSHNSEACAQFTVAPHAWWVYCPWASKSD